MPHSYAPNIENNEQLQQEFEKYQQQQERATLDETILETILNPAVLTPEKEKMLFSKIDLDGAKEWNEELKVKTKDLFQEYAHIFALESLDMGHTSMVKHKIKLGNYTPFKERYQCIPPNLFDVVKNHLKELIQVGAVRCSNSPWVSAVVLVRKKDGSLQFCIDLRRLNACTIKDACSLPHIHETLDCLGGTIIFTSLDLKSGYWQDGMDEESKPLTALRVGPLAFFECERMPFDLTNALAIFQHLMETCLGELHLSWCIIYLDDIIVFSKTLEEHLKRLRGVFEKLAKTGLKLKPSRCEFFKSKITYLGHIASAKGIKIDPKMIEAVKNWTTPKTVTDVRSFLGFTNHYRRFIKEYAKVAKPLNFLVSEVGCFLANYDFSIFYKTSKTNVRADALSRIPRSEHVMIDVPTVKAIINVVSHINLLEYNFHPTDIVCKSTQVVVHKKSRDDWKTEQENDPIIGLVIKAMRSKKYDTSQMNNDSKRLLCSRSRLLFHCGLLYRKVFDGQLQESIFQFVLSKPYWKQSLDACHDNMGHLGIERTTSLPRDWFYWPTMIEDIEHHIKSCSRCLLFKTQPEKAELNPIIATRPLELVHIDYLTIESPANSKSDKVINMLIITDHFTQYAQAHITSSQKAQVVVKTLWDHFCPLWGS